MTLFLLARCVPRGGREKSPLPPSTLRPLRPLPRFPYENRGKYFPSVFVGCQGGARGWGAILVPNQYSENGTTKTEENELKWNALFPGAKNAFLGRTASPLAAVHLKTSATSAAFPLRKPRKNFSPVFVGAKQKGHGPLRPLSRSFPFRSDPLPRNQIGMPSASDVGI